MIVVFLMNKIFFAVPLLLVLVVSIASAHKWEAIDPYTQAQMLNHYRIMGGDADATWSDFLQHKEQMIKSGACGGCGRRMSSYLSAGFAGCSARQPVSGISV